MAGLDGRGTDRISGIVSSVHVKHSRRDLVNKAIEPVSLPDKTGHIGEG